MFLRVLVACWFPLAALANPPSTGALVGKPLKTLDGQEVRLSQFRGQPLLVNVWASWCAPCREEMPALQRLMDSRPPFRVLTVAVDEDTNLVREFLIQFGLHLPVLLTTPPHVTTALAPQGLPTTWLISADGQTLTQFVGPRPWGDPAFRQTLIRRISLTSGSAPSVGTP